MKNIRHHKGCWEVRVTRSGVTHHGFAPDEAAAVALRGQFIARLGPVVPPVFDHSRPAGHSNTGVTGVTEMVHWRRGRPHPFVKATWYVKGRRVMRRFYVHAGRLRDEAIWQAVQARRAAKPQTLLPEELPL